MTPVYSISHYRTISFAL